MPDRSRELHIAGSVCTCDRMRLLPWMVPTDRPWLGRPSSAAGRKGRRRMSNQGKLSKEKKEIRRRFQSGGISSRAPLRHESSAGREKIRGGSIYLLGNPRMTPILSAENANTLASETRRYFGL